MVSCVYYYIVYDAIFILWILMSPHILDTFKYIEIWKK